MEKDQLEWQRQVIKEEYPELKKKLEEQSNKTLQNNVRMLGNIGVYAFKKAK